MESNKNTPLSMALGDEERHVLLYIFKKVKEYPPTNFTQHQLFLYTFGCVQLALPGVIFDNSFVVIKLIDNESTGEPDIEVAYVSSRLKEIFRGFCSHFKIAPTEDGIFVFQEPALLEEVKLEPYRATIIDTIMEIFKGDKTSVYSYLKAIFKSYKVTTLVYPRAYADRVILAEQEDQKTQGAENVN